MNVEVRAQMERATREMALRAKRDFVLYARGDGAFEIVPADQSAPANGAAVYTAYADSPFLEVTRG